MAPMPVCPPPHAGHGPWRVWPALKLVFCWSQRAITETTAAAAGGPGAFFPAADCPGSRDPVVIAPDAEPRPGDHIHPHTHRLPYLPDAPARGAGFACFQLGGLNGQKTYQDPTRPSPISVHPTGTQTARCPRTLTRTAGRPPPPQGWPRLHAQLPAGTTPEDTMVSEHRDASPHTTVSARRTPAECRSPGATLLSFSAAPTARERCARRQG